MALVKPSALVGSISGSVGGVTFKVTRNGLVATKRTGRKGYATERATESRAAMSALVSAWRALSAAQQKRWKTSADNTMHWNRLGEGKRYTGFEWYVSCNRLRQLSGDALEEEAPLVGYRAQIKDLSWRPTFLGFGVYVTTRWTTYDSYVWIFGQTSSGPGLPYHNRWAYVTRSISSGTHDIALLAAWTAALGAPQDGENIRLRAIMMNAKTGPSAPQELRATYDW